jgi:TolA-binding protein
MAASEAPPSASYAEDATVTAPAQMGVTSERTELLGRLARVEPPRYSPSVLRGFPDDAMSAFQQGMKSYVVGNYGAAVPPLRIAANLDPTRPDFAFFLAATELLSGDVAAAATEFTRTIEMGDTPFREEAHFYLAKAHLKQRDVDGARRELMMVTGMQGALRHDADVLLKQLESVDSNE